MPLPSVISSTLDLKTFQASEHSVQGGLREHHVLFMEFLPDLDPSWGFLCLRKNFQMPAPLASTSFYPLLNFFSLCLMSVPSHAASGPIWRLQNESIGAF
jgi:hypothetical protein